MKRIFTLLLATSLCMSIGAQLPSYAQDSDSQTTSESKPVSKEKRELIIQVIENSEVQERVESSWKVVVNKLGSNLLRIRMNFLKRKYPDKSKAERLESARATVKDIILNFSRRTKKAYMMEYKEILVESYDKFFTEDDLRAMLEFYKTPTGKKCQTHTPKMIKEISAQLKTNLDPKVARLLKERLQKSNDEESKPTM